MHHDTGGARNAVCAFPVDSETMRTYDWFQTLDSGKEVCAVFFDIQKAFDTIPHHALMQKLQLILASFSFCVFMSLYNWGTVH